MSPSNDVAAAAMNGVELVASWLTPTVLFCVLNVMIGTIFFRSSLKPQQTEQESKDQPPPPRLIRISSFLERVKAFNLSTYQSPQLDSEARDQEDPYHVARSKPDAVANAFNLFSYRSKQPDPAAREHEELHHVARSRSDAVVNAFHMSNYRSPQPEPAAREEEEPRHAPDSVANEFSFPSYQSLQPVPSAREKEEPRHAPDSVANAFSFPSYQSLQPEPAAREHEEPHHVAAGSKPDPVAEAFNLSSYQFPQRESPAREHEESHHVTRTTSDAVMKAAPAARPLQKSASEKISMEREEEDEERWRPATVRERTGGDEEVDEKADDFISKFRQQLKLQRMDSNLRSDEMLNRGAGRWR